MTNISLTYLIPKGNKHIKSIGLITYDMMQSHIKVTKKKLMYGVLIFRGKC